MTNVTLPFTHPFVMTITGPTQCGKTMWINKLIENIDVMVVPTPDKALFLYTTFQPIYDEIKKNVAEKNETSSLKEIKFIDCNNGIPTVADLRKNFGYQTLLILDDLMINAANATNSGIAAENMKNLNNFVCRDSHHHDMFVIFVCQDIGYKDGVLKTLRKNMHYHVVFVNHNDYSTFSIITHNKKISDGTFKRVYDDIKEDKHGYVVFDGKNDSYGNCRIRTGVFPQDNTYVYDV